MGIVELIIIIAIIGCIVWAITTYLPMEKPFKGVIIVIALLFVLFIIVRALGLDVGSLD